MAERDIDLLIVLPQSDPIDVLYMSGGEQGALLIPAEGDPWILLGRRGQQPRGRARGLDQPARERDAVRLDQAPYGASGGGQAAPARAGNYHASRSPASTATATRTSARMMATRPTRACAASSTRSKDARGRERRAGHAAASLREERGRDRGVPRRHRGRGGRSSGDRRGVLHREGTSRRCTALASQRCCSRPRRSVDRVVPRAAEDPAASDRRHPAGRRLRRPLRGRRDHAGLTDDDSGRGAVLRRPDPPGATGRVRLERRLVRSDAKASVPGATWRDVGPPRLPSPTAPTGR